MQNTNSSPRPESARETAGRRRREKEEKEEEVRREEVTRARAVSPQVHISLFLCFTMPKERTMWKPVDHYGFCLGITMKRIGAPRINGCLLEPRRI